MPSALHSDYSFMFSFLTIPCVLTLVWHAVECTCASSSHCHVQLQPHPAGAAQSRGISESAQEAAQVPSSGGVRSACCPCSWWGHGAA